MHCDDNTVSFYIYHNRINPTWSYFLSNSQSKKFTLRYSVSESYIIQQHCVSYRDCTVPNETNYITLSCRTTYIYIYIYICRTAPLTSRCCILYIYSTNKRTEYFKYAAHSPFFFSSKCRLFHNATFFGSCVIHILYTGCAKIKKKKFRCQRDKEGEESILGLHHGTISFTQKDKPLIIHLG